MQFVTGFEFYDPKLLKTSEKLIIKKIINHVIIFNEKSSNSYI